MAILLLVSSASIQAELCPNATFDPAINGVTIPCVTSGKLQLSLQLEVTTQPVSEELHFKLVSSGLSSCQWAPGSCSTLDDQLNLTIPVEGIVENTKHVAGLSYYPTATEGFHWQYYFHEVINTDNVVTVKTGIPNPNGGFESLYLFEGDVANLEIDEFHDFQMGEGVIPPKVKQFEKGQEIVLRIFHFNSTIKFLMLFGFAAIKFLMPKYATN